ncbi:uncharacterized protein LOC129607747 [Condylostylus longicornis]|uniref:uncharacterized protein LOC129607747 n=1 Tax=Condylostylus longicornis TaxID=2530218 RepID=UPI00244DB8E3|nr:uncharacterized protein LOC129607747 [Condylostylus longicornis]
MSSSEDEINDRKIKDILQAVDTNFLPNDIYGKSRNIQDAKDVHPNLSENNNLFTCNEPSKTIKEVIPSQRYLENQCFEQDHLKISETMQEFVAKKLSNMIENKFEFVELPPIKKVKKSQSFVNGVKLLTECDSFINPEKSDIIELYTKKKPLIKRRKFDSDPSENLSHLEKIKLAVIDPQCVINKEDIRHWNERKKFRVYHYKGISGSPFQFVEPDNEFTILRRKNNWNLKKISRQTNYSIVNK